MQLRETQAMHATHATNKQMQHRSDTSCSSCSRSSPDNCQPCQDDFSHEAHPMSQKPVLTGIPCYAVGEMGISK